MRDHDGLLLLVGSTSTRGSTPPYLGPYFGAKAGMDALAACYALEVARFGIETAIIVPGAFTHGTSQFAHSSNPADYDAVAQQYDSRHPDPMDQVSYKLTELEPGDADVADVARAILRVVDTEKGHRPFRLHIDPSSDGAKVVNTVPDRIRAEFLRRIELDDLLHLAQF